jgi:hypothetical protein
MKTIDLWRFFAITKISGSLILIWFSPKEDQNHKAWFSDSEFNKEKKKPELQIVN